MQRCIPILIYLGQFHVLSHKEEKGDWLVGLGSDVEHIASCQSLGINVRTTLHKNLDYLEVAIFRREMECRELLF